MLSGVVAGCDCVNSIQKKMPKADENDNILTVKAEIVSIIQLPISPPSSAANELRLKCRQLELFETNLRGNWQNKQIYIVVCFAG